MITAPSFEEQLLASLNGVTELILDFKDLVYISSAGDLFAGINKTPEFHLLFNMLTSFCKSSNVSDVYLGMFDCRTAPDRG